MFLFFVFVTSVDEEIVIHENKKKLSGKPEA